MHVRPIAEVSDIRLLIPAGYLRCHRIATKSGSAVLRNIEAGSDEFTIYTPFDQVGQFAPCLAFHPSYNASLGHRTCIGLAQFAESRATRALS